MKIREITCRDAIHSIPHFMDHTMTQSELRDFMYHVENCPECMEELSIQYLVKQGLEGLDDNGPINLQADLDRTLQETRNRILKHEKIRKVLIFAECISIILLLLIIYLTIR